MRKKKTTSTKRRKKAMRMSKMFFKTLREDPSEAEIASHKLLLRGGFIKKSASGIYSYMNLGYRVIRKIESIVREEMDSHDAQEINMSAVQPRELWEESGRWDTFGPEMFKLKDRNDREFCLAPTAEEFFTDLVRSDVNSYKKLPINIYQIKTKYRDEKRPRFGINRAREFLMKDAYSFDKTQEDMVASYKNMWEAYENIYDRLELDYRIVRGDSGAIGGNESHEFTALSDVGEGVITYCDSCDFSATDEKAEVAYNYDNSSEDIKELEKVETKGVKTIDDLAELLKVDKDRCLKAVDLMVKGEKVVVFIPGSRELNLTKLIKHLGCAEHEIEMMGDEDIKSMDSFPGYTGPIGLKADRLIADERVKNIKNMVIGANEENYHYMNYNLSDNEKFEFVDDLLMIAEGDVCPKCGGKLEFKRGIEVGNIFQLGQKYSKSMKATFLDENGKDEYFWMGCYGVGISRTVSAIVEQNNDEKGIIWPISSCPYEAIVTIVNVKDEEQNKLAEEIYEKLLKENVEVLLDDRAERAGVKFNDRDLIGIPLRITVGKLASEGKVEYSTRREMENEEIDASAAIDKIIAYIKERKNNRG